MIMNKKIFLIPLLMVSNLLSLNPNYDFAIAKNESIETSDVLNDLNQIGGFNIEQYKNVEFDLIYIAEYGYNLKSSDLFNIYFYFYFNPDVYDLKTSYYSDVNFLYDSELNSVSFLNEETNISTGPYYIDFICENDNFYKYKLEVPLNFYKQDQDVRTYLFDTFKLSCNGTLKNNLKQNFIKTYTTDKRFTYKSTYEDVEEFQVGVNGTQYLSLDCYGGSVNAGPSAEGIGHSNLLYYVWFSVPNAVLDDIGNISYIRYEREKYKLKRMYHLASYLTLDEFQNYYISDTPSLLISGITDYEKYGGNGTSINYVRDFSKIEEYRMYYSENSTDIIPGSSIEYNINKYGISSMALNTYQDAYEEIIIHDDDYLDLLGMTPGSKDMMTNILWSILYGYDITGPTIENLKAIEKIEKEIVDSDNFVSDGKTFNKYVVDSSDVDAFNSYYFDCLNDNKSMYLFRFDVDPTVFSFSLYATNNSLQGWDDVGFATDTSCIINFKIIEIGFKLDEQLTIIPVLMDPINIIPDGIPPYIDWTNRNIFGAVLGIIGLIILIVLLALIYPYVAPIFTSISASANTRKINKQTKAINKQVKALEKVNKSKDKKGEK